MHQSRLLRATWEWEERGKLISHFSTHKYTNKETNKHNKQTPEQAAGSWEWEGKVHSLCFSSSTCSTSLNFVHIKFFPSLICVSGSGRGKSTHYVSPLPLVPIFDFSISNFPHLSFFHLLYTPLGFSISAPEQAVAWEWEERGKVCGSPYPIFPTINKQTQQR